MMERLCRAACASDYDAPDRSPPPQPKDWWVDHHWRLYRRSVIAIVAALREPTEAMERATISINPCQSTEGQCYDEAEIWRAMVDAITVDLESSCS